MSIRTQIKEAVTNRALVRIERRDGFDRVNGYVLEAGQKFFLMLILGDGIRYDGFQVLRFVDVVKVWSPAPHAPFVEKALRLRGLRRPRKPRIDLSSLLALLNTVSRQYALLTIHREAEDPEVCQIGRLQSVNATSLSLLEIDPDAEWDEAPTKYRCAEITRVDFGGAYEDALSIVAASVRPRAADALKRRT